MVFHSLFITLLVCLQVCYIALLFLCLHVQFSNDMIMTKHEMTMSAGFPVPVLGYPQFGFNTGLYYLDDLQCDGSESNLLRCRAEQPGVHDCSIAETAGVFCPSEWAVSLHNYHRNYTLVFKHMCLLGYNSNKMGA